MPTASKSNTKKFKLASVVSEIKGKHPAIEIETEDGTFEIPPPQLWPDEIMAVGDEPVKATKLLLGDQYGAFIAAGGSAAILMQIIAQSQGVEDMGESSAS